MVRFNDFLNKKILIENYECPFFFQHYSASIHPNVFSPALTIIAENGNVILESQDWAASLGLKMATPKYKKDELQL